MKRISFITTIGVPWGGSEELWSRTAARLLQHNVEVNALTGHWSEPVPQIDNLNELGCHITHNKPLSRWRRIFGKKQTDWLDRSRPDFVVISQAHHIAGLEWMRACAERNIPYAIIVQAAGEMWWPDDDIISQLVAGFEQAVSCFFVSNGNLNFIRKQLATPLTAAKVIRNPFNVSYDACPPWPSTDVYKLACPARLEPYAKGQDILFEVLESEKWRKRPLQVTLYGSGRNATSLKRLKERMKLENVTFGGFVSDIESVWSTHHGLVLPSRVEGLPLAVVEAMLCGRICVVTDVAGNAELLDDDITGFVAHAPTPCLVDQALERAWDKQAQWQQMGKVAAERVRGFVPRDPIEAFTRELLPLIA